MCVNAGVDSDTSVGPRFSSALSTKLLFNFLADDLLDDLLDDPFVVYFLLISLDQAVSQFSSFSATGAWSPTRKKCPSA